jgi:putative pantetheine hydrolase
MADLAARATARAAMNPRAGPRNDLTDVAGVRVGHHHRVGRGWRTGTTVVLPPAATIAAVEVRGGGPGTRETDALDPRNLVPHAHAVCLTGGSAYGLAAADGVMAWLEEHGIGFPVGPEPHQVVPIVPTAVLFDLGRGGAFGHRPGPAFGYAATARAARARRPAAVVEGSVGAAAGAATGPLAGGIGSASVVLEDGSTVAALVAVNAAGRVDDPETGVLHGAAALVPTDPAVRRPARAEVIAAAARWPWPPPIPPLNTTIGVVATDAKLHRAEAQRLAGAGHNGLARAVRPSHLLNDGDTFFVLATGEHELPPEVGSPERTMALNVLASTAADVVTRSIVRGVLAARSFPDRPSYRDLYPSSFPVERRRR